MTPGLNGEVVGTSYRLENGVLIVIYLFRVLITTLMSTSLLNVGLTPLSGSHGSPSIINERTKTSRVGHFETTERFTTPTQKKNYLVNFLSSSLGNTNECLELFSVFLEIYTQKLHKRTKE